MRFETSQTTPPHLDRRLQLRMLSFVGLIAVIMFTLSAINLRPRDANSQRSSTVTPDSLTFEVRREERELKEGEFVIPLPEEDGIRGQSPRSTANRDHDLFAPRNKERSRQVGNDDKLFPRRTSTARKAAGLDLDDERNPVDLSNLYNDEVPLGTRSTTDRRPPAGSPLVDEDWSSEPVAIDGREAGRRSPSIVTPKRRYEVPTEPLEEPRDSLSPERTGNDDLSLPRRPIEASGLDEDPELPPAGRRAPTPRGGLAPDSTRDLFDDENLEPPIDLRRRRTPSRVPADATPPPYGEIAPVMIDKRYLDVVKDNTIGIRRDESEVFYWLLDHARRVPSSALERAGDREVQYINLMTEPERYRGEPITIEGDLWRLYEFDAGKNDYAVSKIYEGWVFTGDSSNHPYRVVCTSLPSGIEPGENLRIPVRITGYFFKREGYRSNGGVHVAPTLLARRIGINPMPNGIPLTAGILPYMIGAIMAIGLALLVTIVGFAIGDRRSSRDGMERLRRHPQFSLAGMEIPEPVSVEESLRQFAEQESASAVTGAYGPLFSRQAAREHAVHDYATSQKILTDASHRLHRQQTGTLQSWSARQLAAQAEIEALRGAPPRQPGDSATLGDELNSDEFDPAKNILARPKTAEHSATRTSGSHPTKLSGAASPIATPSMETKSKPANAKVETTPPVVKSDLRPTNVAYSASKLSEWEEEIARMTPPTAPKIDLPHATGSHPSDASVPVDPQQQLRDQELLNQIRIDREHMERERLMRDEVVHEHLDEDRMAFDRADRDVTSFSLASSPADVDDSAGMDDDAAAEELSDENETPSRWGRFRKRRNR